VLQGFQDRFLHKKIDRPDKKKQRQGQIDPAFLLFSYIFWTSVQMLDYCLEPGKIDALKLAWFIRNLHILPWIRLINSRANTSVHSKGRWKFKYSLCIIVTDANSCNCITVSSAWFSDIIETYQSRMNGLNDKNLLLEQFNVLPRTIDGSHRYNGLPLES